MVFPRYFSITSNVSSEVAGPLIGVAINATVEALGPVIEVAANATVNVTVEALAPVIGAAANATVASAIPFAVSIGGGYLTTQLIAHPKAVAFVAFKVAERCYSSTGSKRLACAAAVITCGTALVPGPHQVPFVLACGIASFGADQV
jgi:hypothetical protein